MLKKVFVLTAALSLSALFCGAALAGPVISKGYVALSADGCVLYGTDGSSTSAAAEGYTAEEAEWYRTLNDKLCAPLGEVEVCSLIDFVISGDAYEPGVASIDISLAAPLTEEQAAQVRTFKRAGASMSLYFSDEDEKPLELMAAGCGYRAEGDRLTVTIPEGKAVNCLPDEYYVLVLSVPKESGGSSGCNGTGAAAAALILTAPLFCAALKKRNRRPLR